MKIYLLCPVRRASDTLREILEAEVKKLEIEGHEVFYPARDNPFETVDLVGDGICSSNVGAIKHADEVHIYWMPESTGSKFDLGAVWVYEKPIVLLNEFEANKGPSFGALLQNWPFGVRKELIANEEEKIIEERLKALGYTD